jgi:D-cysteine desulfhydrase
MPFSPTIDIPFPPRLRLSRIPTPIEMLQWMPPALAEAGVEVFIKRDDLTECSLSGNKVRKLDFLLADALAHDCDTIITCGDVNSNHCRATALGAARLGMRAHLILRGERPSHPDGNLFLSLLGGAGVEFITAQQYAERDSLLAETADRLQANGRRPYVIPEGGSNALGCFGYVNCAREIAYQSDRLSYEFSHIVCATGSGGTQAGLIIGTRAYLPKVQVLGVNVCDDAESFRKRIGAIIEQWSREFKTDLNLGADDTLVIGGYEGPGYGRNTAEDLELIRTLARSQGLLLDPTYTIKAFRALCEEAKRGRFARGSSILFMHTGGLFGLFPRRDDLLAETALGSGAETR